VEIVELVSTMYMREGTTLRVMVADGPYDKFYDFYSVSPVYFGYIVGLRRLYQCGNIGR
jgi:hypothetical protein